MTNTAVSTTSPTPQSTVETEAKSKRKASTAGLPANARPVKRRASKACCCCRARKVRCDVVENGSPCTNCRLDQVECIVTESKRRKFVHVEYISSVFPPQKCRLTTSAPCCHCSGNHVLRSRMQILTSCLNHLQKSPMTGQVCSGDLASAMAFPIWPQLLPRSAL